MKLVDCIIFILECEFNNKKYSVTLIFDIIKRNPSQASKFSSKSEVFFFRNYAQVDISLYDKVLQSLW